MLVVSTSEKNKKHVEKKILPTQKFQNFGKNFGGVEQYTFEIILTNVY
jgi:hypothetical protein